MNQHPFERFIAVVGSPILLAVLVLGALTACSSTDTASASDGGLPPDSSPSSSPFVGAWACTGTGTLAITEPRNSTQMSPDASTLVITADGSNLTVVHELPDGGPATCTFHLAEDGDSATFLPGQSCPQTVDAPNGTMGTFTASYASGTATISGSTLTVTHTGPIQGTVNADGGSIAIAGTETVTVTCARL